MRYFVDLAFKGTAYHGWQRQENAHSVQEEIENALSTFLSEKIEVVGAGRTDTGVHASHMVLHFDLDKEVDLQSAVFQLNSILPKDIAFRKIRKVKDDFHARFSATTRTYRYYIHRQKDPFQEDASYFFRPELDLLAMNEAAKLLLGKKDFSSFSKAHTQTFTNDCDIKEALWIQENEHRLYFQITADRFLRNMVRAIVGTLIEVGQGKRTVDSIVELIASKDRKKAGYSVPAEGLYLYHIEYPEEGFI
ncbi:MAG: tRNA pseudouridine(38-40) synthase TruA [Flavobacteriales bacterium]|nr:tRNA pseudouridine(38-40) synthase TruA [Flavobacteriales bacterium]|tara:strand:- start:100 stop:846 length:747 start_codon:yes stop_codon:yes gene_type:complete